ncbi:MAG: hypothetical protein LBD10_06560 [Desulfobulbus sp.]|jgi:hypothetical protein|uniref:hypothetical protein n=1 Tax=Desulfobulbus sp. TaxID=895 RepID=UPI00283DB504|nr:hypothetical protein [Desulfobulbus sp.]MDR2549839.1 hypothetical protein [Desulfobulbus sp.]
MKKVLLTGAALMLASGVASTAAAADEPGVKITGDARVRMYYADDQFRTYGTSRWQDSQTNMDSRVRVNLTGTSAGGAYAKVRLRIAESNMGDLDTDYSNSRRTNSNSNVAADMAYVGIPFNDQFTLELGRYRSTYGPQPSSYNFFYDDVNLTGARGIIKLDKVVINPFVEWMEEAQNGDDVASGSLDQLQDNDEIRFGVHAKAQLNKDWLIGGMIGYQMDNRNERRTTLTDFGWQENEGFFGSFYVNGKSGNFGLIGEIAVTDNNLNNFNSWEDDLQGVTSLPGGAVAGGVDRIGSQDTGYGGYIFPNYQINKLNIGLNLGFTANGFQPDGAFGDGVMLGTIDNSVISALRIGDYGDWLWGGLVVSYQVKEDLKLTGNFFYADIDSWGSVGPDGDGPNTGFRSLGKTRLANGTYVDPGLENAWTISAIMQYTISKNLDLFLSAGYLKPEFDNAYNIAGLDDDGIFAAASRLELKF